MGIIFKTTNKLTMSYYDYYGGYGDDVEAPVEETYEEPAPMEMEEESSGSAMTPVQMAFFLVPIFDLVGFYQINDANSTSNSDWTMAANVCLAGGIVKLLAIGADIGAGVAIPIYPISIVQELISLYLINTANGSLADDSVNIYYGMRAVSVIISGANVALAGGAAEEEVADDYYGEEEAPVEEEAEVVEEDDDYYGYY